MSGFRDKLTVRNTLSAVTGVTTALLVWLTASFWWDAYCQREDAVNVLATSAIEKRLVEATHAWSAERLLMQIILKRPSIATSDELDQLRSIRAKGDQLFDGAVTELAAAKPKEDARNAIESALDSHRQLAVLRAELDKVAALPKDKRLDRDVDRWLPGISDHVSTVLRLKSMARYVPERAAPEVEALQDMVHASVLVLEFARRENALVAGPIAAVDFITLSDVQRMFAFRGRLEQAWSIIEQYIRRDKAEQGLVKLAADSQAQYFKSFEAFRTKVIDLGMSGEEYNMNADQWTAAAAAGTSSLAKLVERSLAVLTTKAKALEAHGTRRLMIDSVLLLAAFALAGISIFIVMGWVVRPLNSITRVMTAVAAGDSNVSVPSQDRQGEIGEMARAVQAFKDTVEQKARELSSVNSELVNLNEELEDRVRERTAEMERARDEAIEASLAKSAFLANMSHELRTPLNAIIGYSEILVEEAEDLGQEDVFIPDLKRIQSAGRHLLSLINDVLDISKIEAGKMDMFLEAFDVNGMLDDVMSTVAPLVEKNDNRLVVDVPADLGSMTSDLTKVRQTLFNLLSNACKFTEKGEVTLSAKVRSHDGADIVEFSVRDTGIGMSAEQCEKVFSPFIQADGSTTRKYGGTGLGLSITKSFCELLGGSIALESTEGQGSVFSVVLPRDASESSVKSPVDEDERAAAVFDDDEGEDASGERRTILVADDDPVILDLMSRHLKRAGYHVLTAKSGRRALEMARAAKPDAMTLDVLMPDMDGWAVLNEVKSDPELSSIPVVIVSMVDEKQMGFSLGAVDYLAKPINRERLISTMEKHCPKDRRGKVLIVEDDDDVRDIMVRSLDRHNWEVSEAVNGRIGLERISEQVPDLILLDLMMPEMDGFEFVERLRDNVEWRRIPVVVVTAKELTNEDREALNGHVQKLVRKGERPLSEVIEELDGLIAVERSAAGGS